MANWVRAVTPRSMVLDLLRVAAPNEVSVRALVDVGGMFGLEGNATRVALTRLISRGLVEPARRGWYRLAASAQPVNELVEEWRLGERRMTKWRGDWLAVWQPRVASRSAQARSVGALERLGFVAGPKPLWLRPNNLAPRVDGTRRRLVQLGLADDAEVFVMSELSTTLAEQIGGSWPAKTIRARLRKTAADLRRSAARINSLSHERALVETFMLGGAAIRWLSVDPLLPEELLNGDDRRALTQQMLAYDKLGRDLWRQSIDRARLNATPSHLGVFAQEGAA